NLLVKSVEWNPVTALQDIPDDFSRHHKLDGFRLLARPLDHRKSNSSTGRRLDQETRDCRPMTVPRLFAGAEVDDPAALLCGVDNELQELINSGRISDFEAPATAPDPRIAEFPQPKIPIPARRLFKCGAAEPRGPRAPRKANVRKNGRSPATTALDRID